MRPGDGGDIEPALDGLAVDEVLQAQPIGAGLGVALGEADIDQGAHEVEGGGLGESGADGKVAQRHPVAAGHDVEQRLGARHGLDARLGFRSAGLTVSLGCRSSHDDRSLGDVAAIGSIW